MTRHFKRAFQSAAALLTAGSLLAGVIASAAQYPMGDIDANGDVDTIDALSILIEYVATTVMQKESTMTEQQRTAADINHDGTIDAADALSTLQYYVADNMGNTPEDWEYYEAEDSAATTTTTTEVTTTTTTTTETTTTTTETTTETTATETTTTTTETTTAATTTAETTTVTTAMTTTTTTTTTTTWVTDATGNCCPEDWEETVTTTVSTEPIDLSVPQYIPDSDLWYTLVDGVLTIGGVGDMPELEVTQRPWEYDETIIAVYVNEGVTSIADYAFSYCTNLTEVYVPASVSQLGLWAFYHCDSLQMIEVAEDNAYYASIDGVLFDKDQTTILLYPYNANTEYSIPKGVQTIGYAAFQSHPTLTALTIPDSVIFIEEGAFAACDSLTDVYYTGTEGQWNAIVNDCGFDESTMIHFNS